MGTAGLPGRFAPYVDMTLHREDLVALSRSSGARTFTLAFVVSGNGCVPSWGGVVPVGSTQDYVGAAIDAFRRQGGAVIISFGGEAGTELAEACRSVASLSSAYRLVVSTYGVYNLDFDIEGAALADAQGERRRWQAVAELQRYEAHRGHRLDISLTLPVLPSGLPAPGTEALDTALTAGVRPSIVNIMTMDYGNAVASPTDMGTDAVQAARSVEGQLAQRYPQETPAQLWAMVGITPLLGQNDIPDEVFTLNDADQVARFATAQGAGRLSMWSVSRDQQCPQGPVDYDDPTCSGVLQSPWAFSHIFEG